MAERVVAVNLIRSNTNPAAMEKKINELVAVFYSGPEWERQGPNFIRNRATGEVVNLNQKASEILLAEAPRKDAVAVVESAGGETRTVFIEQEAVKAAGENMQVLASNLQKVLSDDSVIPAWVWMGGAGVVLFLLLRKRGR